MLNEHGRYVSSTGLSETGTVSYEGIAEDGVRVPSGFVARFNGAIAGGHSNTSISSLNGIGGALIAGTALFATLIVGVGGAVAESKVTPRYLKTIRTTDGMILSELNEVYPCVYGKRGAIAGGTARMTPTSITGRSGGVMDMDARISTSQIWFGGMVAGGSPLIGIGKTVTGKGGATVGGGWPLNVGVAPKGGMIAGGDASFGGNSYTAQGGAILDSRPAFSVYYRSTLSTVMTNPTSLFRYRGIKGTGGAVISSDDSTVTMKAVVNGLEAGGAADIQQLSIVGTGGGYLAGWTVISPEISSSDGMVIESLTHVFGLKSSSTTLTVVGFGAGEIEPAFTATQGGVLETLTTIGQSSVIGRDGGVGGRYYIPKLKATAYEDMVMTNPSPLFSCGVLVSTGGGVIGSKGLAPTFSKSGAVVASKVDIQQLSIAGTAGGVIDRTQSPKYSQDAKLPMVSSGGARITALNMVVFTPSGAVAGGKAVPFFTYARIAMVMASKPDIRQLSIEGKGGAVTNNIYTPTPKLVVFEDMVHGGTGVMLYVHFPQYAGGGGVVTAWGIMPLMLNKGQMVMESLSDVKANTMKATGGAVVRTVQHPEPQIKNALSAVGGASPQILKGMVLHVVGGAVVGAPGVMPTIYGVCPMVVESITDIQQLSITTSGGLVIDRTKAPLARRVSNMPMVSTGKSNVFAAYVLRVSGGAVLRRSEAVTVSTKAPMTAVMDSKTLIQQLSVITKGGMVSGGHLTPVVSKTTKGGVVLGDKNVVLHFVKVTHILGSVAGGVVKFKPQVGVVGGMVAGGAAKVPYGTCYVSGGAVIKRVYPPKPSRQVQMPTAAWGYGHPTAFATASTVKSGAVAGNLSWTKTILATANGKFSMVVQCNADIQQLSIVTTGGLVIDRMFPPKFNRTANMPMVSRGDCKIVRMMFVKGVGGAYLDNPNRVIPMHFDKLGVVQGSNPDFQQLSIRGTSGAVAKGHSVNGAKRDLNIKMVIIGGGEPDCFKLMVPHGGAVVGGRTLTVIKNFQGSGGGIAAPRARYQGNHCLAEGGAVSGGHSVLWIWKPVRNPMVMNRTTPVIAFFDPHFPKAGGLVSGHAVTCVATGIPKWLYNIYGYNWQWYGLRGVVAGGRASCTANMIKGSGGGVVTHNGMWYWGGSSWYNLYGRNTIMPLLKTNQGGRSMIAGGDANILQLLIIPASPGGGTGGGDDFIFLVCIPSCGGVIDSYPQPVVCMTGSGTAIHGSKCKVSQALLWSHRLNGGLGIDANQVLMSNLTMSDTHLLMNTLSRDIGHTVATLQSIERGSIPSIQKILGGMPNVMQGEHFTSISISSSAQSVKSTINSILNDPTMSLQALRSSLTTKIEGMITSLQAVSTDLTAVQVSVGKVENNPQTATYSTLVGLVDSLKGTMVKLQVLSSVVMGEQVSTYAIERDGQTALQALHIGLAEELSSTVASLQTISTDTTAVQANTMRVLEEALMDVQSNLQEVINVEFITGVHVVSQIVGELESQMQTVTYEVYLDGVSIKNRIETLKIEFDETSVHNSITLTTADRDLYFACDPNLSGSTARIEVHVGARVLLFLIEERTGKDADYQIWGRGPSARTDAPFCSLVTLTANPQIMASEAAETLAGVCALDWECFDWLLPVTFSMTGTPIEIIQKLAVAVGAVVRSMDDGSLLVRKKYTTRPVDVNSIPPEVSYDRFTNIIELSAKDMQGSYYNNVNVLGYSTVANSVIIEVETESPVRGQDVDVRVYWEGSDPSITDVFVTAGVVEVLGDATGIFTEERTETVEIKDGIGSVSHPITSLVEYSGSITSPGLLTFSPGSKTVTTTVPFALIHLTYTSVYRKYRLVGHDVEELLLVLLTGSEHDISVSVTIDAPGLVSPYVSSELLTSSAAALEAGTAWLDDKRYDAKMLTVQVPYLDEAVDGAIVALNDGELGVSGNGYITKVSIDIEGPKVSNTLEVKQCLV